MRDNINDIIGHYTNLLTLINRELKYNKENEYKEVDLVMAEVLNDIVADLNRVAEKKKSNRLKITLGIIFSLLILVHLNIYLIFYGFQVAMFMTLFLLILISCFAVVVTTLKKVQKDEEKEES